MTIRHAVCEGVTFRYIHRKLEIESPTIVYLGGAFQALESITTCEEWLKNFSHLIIELPGFGESLHLERPGSFELFASCIHTAVSECGLRDIYAYAYSYGVGPMGRYVANHPHNVKGLMVGGASPSLTADMESRIARLIESTRCRKEFIDTFSGNFFYQNEEELASGRLSHMLVKRKLRTITDLEMQRFAENYQILLREHKVNYRIGANVPVMVMGGEMDTFVDKSLLSRFGHYCDNLTVFEISNADHFYYLQRQELVLYLIRQFIDKCNAPIPSTVHSTPDIEYVYR